ncbi:ExbD/TolR family protein [Pararhodobacter sp.]|uniref:ExbD/TolR family protein n=1 Tax=Pararhodobacter sp. TaxID=2127056 RepID=UPI002FDE10B9
MITLGPPRPRRRMSLTPMIDVVFLLLIFFMLAARFGVEGVLALSGGTGGGQGWSGPPRLVEFAPGGAWLNGSPLSAEALPGALAPLMQGPDDPVILRPRDGASLQHLTDLSERLVAGGLTRLVLVEP